MSTSASYIRVDTRVLNAPGASTANGDFRQVPQTISYYNSITNLRTLSSNTASASQSPEGLLYVPRLDSSSSCNNATAQYIPDGVARKSSMPGANYALIAAAPWVSPQCTQEFLAAGRADVVKSFIFFLPGNGDAAPPQSDEMAWSLSDGGQWKTQNAYPVFAVSSNTGADLMRNLALYSGNMSSVPNGNQIPAAISTDPSNYVRLYTFVQLTSTQSLPSLWIFLIVVLAILLAVVGCTSLVMNFLQRRRREDLRRRIAAGQVDLETLGIKRVLVPRDCLDKMPIRNYEKDEPSTDAQVTNPPVAAGAPDPVDAVKGAVVPKRHLDQPTCAICLDDFVNGESQVRELPCSHIFHPECVDTFLMETSSLCPLCKNSCMPKGYCPEVITNAMVRRERLIRQARNRAESLGLDFNSNQVIDRSGNLLPRYRQDLERGFNQFRMTDTGAANLVRTQEQADRVGPSPPPAQREERRRWAARRAEAMLGPRTAPREVVDDTSNIPRWQAAVRRVFPTR